MCKLVSLIVLVVLNCTSACLAQVGRHHATDLRCESFANPIGIDEPSPHLSWIIGSSARDERQTAFQILVATTPELLEVGKADAWDSSRVESDQTTNIAYAGIPLRTGTTYHWKVRSWDRDGNPGPWSDARSWEMGLLSPSDWQAKWIDATPKPLIVHLVKAEYRATKGVVIADVTERVKSMLQRGEAIVASNKAMGMDPEFGTPKRLHLEYTLGGVHFHEEVAEDATAAIPPKSVPYLRGAFAVSKEVAHARLYATALGVYELWLNGKRVGDQRLAPGWTDYRQRVQTQAYDVTTLLQPGANMLGAIVGPGWFSGRAGLFHAKAFYGASPALVAQLEIVYADGSTQIVASDTSWTRHDGPILAADIMDGESYDARLAVDGWCISGASEASAREGWKAVTTRDESRVLHAQSDQPVCALKELPAKSVHEVEPGRWIFDLGQNMVGVVRLRVTQPAGTRLTIRHAEMLDPDGTLYTANLRGASAVDTYICRGDSSEVWEPRFTFHGFRFVEVSGLKSPPSLETVTGVVVGTDLPPIGTFDCSDPRINQLQSNIVWGLRGNSLSIPTDCPQRDERMGWTADTQVFAPTAAYNADTTAFMRKWLRDVRDAQREDGAHSDVAPVMKGLNFGTPVWGDAGTVVPWTIYLFSGDRRILEENIESMRRWVDWSAAHSEGFIRVRDRGNDYGDWLSINADTPKDLIGTAYFARSAWIVAQSFKALGRTDEAEQYTKLFQQIRDAFVHQYVHDDGTIEGATQTCSLLALRFDLLPQALRVSVGSHLIDDLQSKGWRLSTGFVGVSHLLPVLDDMGRPDVAYKLLLQDEFPSWLFSIRHGATTIWERWDGWTPEKGMNDPGMNSFNHFALGSCGEWLFGGVAGIRPDPNHPGFSHFFVRPRIDGPLTHASATFQSVHGDISSSWHNEQGKLTFQFSIPPNTSATITLPSKDGTAVLESGNSLDIAEGVKVIERPQNAVVLSVGSGRYEFATTTPTPR